MNTSRGFKRWNSSCISIADCRRSRQVHKTMTGDGASRPLLSIPVLFFGQGVVITGRLVDPKDWALICGRQSKMKCRPLTGVGGCPDTSSVRLNNRATDRQPHTTAFRLGGKEG